MAKQEAYKLVGEVADALGLDNPRVITELFYKGKLDRKRCPVVSMKRRIPVSYIPEIRRILKESFVIES